MAAIDTILTSVANPAAAWTATVPANGDSLGVRYYPDSATAYLLNMVRDGATKGGGRVRSPRLHDNVTGINFDTSETPDVLELTQFGFQTLISTDTLIVEVTGGSAETDVLALSVYYTSLPGSDARLHSWGDIGGNIKSLKNFATAVTNSATIGAWTDTVITTTENQLHANTDYAVLGYRSDTSLAVVGIKGQETGNLRVCGPGTVLGYDTAQWFAQLSQWSQLPTIPVFNSNNRSSIYVSTADKAASTAANVTLVLAELATNLSS